VRDANSAIGWFPRNYARRAEFPGNQRSSLEIKRQRNGSSGLWQMPYFLAGDATYTLDNLRQDKVDGVTYDPAVSLGTLKANKQFAQLEPTVILPTHDPKSEARIASCETYTCT
jgi:glyoxylase-like metal-dependent hydrolase (beta-lactamase superfamily II)